MAPSPRTAAGPDLRIRAAHWNVHTLRGARATEPSADRLQALADHLEAGEVDVCGLAETHVLVRTRTSPKPRRVTAQGGAVFSVHLSNLPASKAPPGETQLQRNERRTLNRRPGVALMIRDGLLGDLKPLASPDASRMLGVRWTAPGGRPSVLIVEAYAPTDPEKGGQRAAAASAEKASGDAAAQAKRRAKEKFYRDLRCLLDAEAADDLLLLGDFNARTGWEPQWRAVVGPCARMTDPGRKSPLGPSPSDNGRRLLGLCAERHLVLVDGLFPRADDDKWTWRSPRGFHNRIDFIAKRRDPDSVLAARGFDLCPDVAVGGVRSDHRMISALLEVARRPDVVSGPEPGPEQPDDAVDGLTRAIAAVRLSTAPVPAPAREEERYQRVAAAAAADDDDDMPTSGDEDDD